MSFKVDHFKFVKFGQFICLTTFLRQRNMCLGQKAIISENLVLKAPIIFLLVQDSEKRTKINRG